MKRGPTWSFCPTHFVVSLSDHLRLDRKFWPSQEAQSVFRSHFGSSRDPSPRLELPLHLPSRQPHQDSFRVRFLFAVHIAWLLLLVALSSSVGNLVVLDLVRYRWWNMGKQLGRSQSRAGLLLTCQKREEKGKLEWQLLSRHVTPQSKRLSRHVSKIKCGLLE